MSCTKCKKQDCFCKKKIPICGEPEHTCHKSEIYNWPCLCHQNIPETEYTTQIDAKEVFYKLKGDSFSNLTQFDIPKGADLEYILEKIFFFIENLSCFSPTFGTPTVVCQGNTTAVTVSVTNNRNMPVQFSADEGVTWFTGNPYTFNLPSNGALQKIKARLKGCTLHTDGFVQLCTVTPVTPVAPSAP